jgi:hypothetical protein
MSACFGNAKREDEPETQISLSRMSVGAPKNGVHWACPPPQIPSGLQKTPTSVHSAFEVHVWPRLWAVTETPEMTGGESR